jgi:hypothetical protein
MGITEKENELFIKWSADRPGFIMDGVPDESAYQASEPKIMFVMKEVEELGGGTGDHREFLRRGASPQPWNNIVRWVIGLRQLDEDIAWNLFVSEKDTRWTSNAQSGSSDYATTGQGEPL